MRIRPAESFDLLQVVDVFWQCWTHTYGAMPGLRSAMDPDRAAALWTGALSDEASTVLVAEFAMEDADGGVLGVVRFLSEREGWGYVASLYVAPLAHGRGVGRALLTAAEEALADAGASRARLWVFAVNTGAQEFYRRGGWLPSGEQRTGEAFGEPELELTKALPTGARRDRRGTDDGVRDDDRRAAGEAPAGESGGAAGGAGAGVRAGDRHAGGG